MTALLLAEVFFANAFGVTEWIVIGGVVFLLFGASRLPQLAKSLGQTRKAFKEGMREAEEEELAEKLEEKNAPRVARAQLSALSDDELLEEARRRAAARDQVR